MAETRLELLEDLLYFQRRKHSLDIGIGDPENLPMILVKPTTDMLTRVYSGISNTLLTLLVKQWRDWDIRVSRFLGEEE